MVTDVIGKPDVVNRTVSANGTSEQWIYRFSYSKDEYYYFENGKLTTWQDQQGRDCKDNRFTTPHAFSHTDLYIHQKQS